MKITLERVYSDPENKASVRILCDRLWPRGIKKSELKHDLWAKEITPTSALRKWYHEHNDFESFRKKYLAELAENKQSEEFIQYVVKHDDITLLTAAKIIEKSHLPILKEYIKKNIP